MGEKVAGAPDDAAMPEWASAMFAQFMDPDIQGRLATLAEVANFDISGDLAQPFLRFHSFITDPQPSYINEWRADPRLEQKWYHPHVNGILGNVRGGLSAAFYHADNLMILEDKVTEIFDGFDFTKLGSSTIGLGQTRKMDIEYHAFILACRRSLDYLALSLCAYFKTENNSFRSLNRAIARTRKPVVSEALIAAHARHTAALDFILADGKSSVRNLIAHYEFVSAGAINLMPQGFFIVGGGENLNSMPGSLKLRDVIQARLLCVHTCIEDMIDSFIGSARTLEP